ncbi:multiple epidermal growth factor-like domains protein 10 [Gigantopelta aegis]|uniref:multiple epidermal growth factor-like domains protein 10 n=1 Tax=Gigantopelta aegis TaxID=1735272 RepID=UPI001B887612|nr:multiple epidermal growth factor-like domains protein 10 [Gigantopelta aegis]
MDVFKYRLRSGICNSGTYGLDCSYTCHCTTNCNDVTGCSGSCKRGWFGSTCSLENVALGNITTMSSYFEYSSGASPLAVDGDLNKIWNTVNCIHTATTDPFTWWQVDLGREFYIHKLAIHFRIDVKVRRNGVEVYSSIDGSPKPTGHLCGSATSSSPDVMWMACDSTARYITLYQKTYNSLSDGQTDTAMDFCEVQVFVCASGTFGDDCSQLCYCRDGPCNYVTGECSGGCKHNWTGRTCSECDSDHYGPFCEHSCSSRHCDEPRSKSSCDQRTGRCDNGCIAEWMGPDCTQKCPEFTYSMRCARHCSQRHCLGNSACDPVTGKCDYGCDRGYQSEDCTTKCPLAKYGFNCNMLCEARHCSGSSTCDRLDGVCIDGCLAGWELPDCSTVSGLYLWHLRGHKTKYINEANNRGSDHSNGLPASRNEADSQQSNQDQATSYINTGQDIELNEYEKLEPKSDNIYEHLTQVPVKDM